MMKKVALQNVPMCLPIEFGICDEGVYSIQSWIEGSVSFVNRKGDIHQPIFTRSKTIFKLLV